jgi:hypothetical protein
VTRVGARGPGFERAWRRFRRACRRFTGVPPMVSQAPPELRRAMRVLHELVELEERGVELEEELLRLLDSMDVERLVAAFPRATSLLAFFAAWSVAEDAARAGCGSQGSPPGGPQCVS